MKFAYVLISFSILLSSCANNKAVTIVQTQSIEPLEAIKAFEAICLKTAPSFSGAAQVATAFGITAITNLGFMKMGFNKDQSMGIQIKSDKECVITTPSQRINGLTTQFLGAVSRYANAPSLDKVPSKVNINGVPFIFHHDRKGGEAYVMLKANG
ncbi:MAG: hypothetical protein CFE38_17910 [Comamonadaceae bacterium PBBC1]|nr:MAG: hypothetical protein CFE38_17910 [Comamonadaceae bacterium PBBC1]